MFIKWKYNDHGWPDFEELEIPDDLGGHESVVDYLCAHDEVPTWSERFSTIRIKWKKVEKTPAQLKEISLGKIERLKITIKGYQNEIKRLNKSLSKYDC